MSPKNLSLKVKLIGGFLAISGLVLVTSVISISGSNTIVALFEDILHNDFPRYSSLLEIKNLTTDITNQTLLLSLEETTSHSIAQHDDEQKNEILANVEKIHSHIHFYEEHIDEAETENVQRLKKLSQTTDSVIDSAFQLIALRDQHASNTAVLAVKDELIIDQQVLRKEIDAIVARELQIIDEEDAAVEITVEQTINNIYMVSLISVILALSGGLFFSIPIVATIRKLRTAASEVAKGNLNVRLVADSHDELGELSESFDQMTRSLKEVNEQREKNAQALNQKTEELARKMEETERTNKLMVGRELKMIELKKEIEQLKQQVSPDKNKESN